MGNSFKLEENWEFIFDPLDEGLLEEWFVKKPPKAAKAALPHDWTGIRGSENAHIGYYFNTFTPEKRTGPTRWILRLDSIQHFATVWLNGEEIGTHFGSFLPFEFDVSRHLKAGESNLLAIRVQEPDNSQQLIDQHASELALGGPYLRAPFAGFLGGAELICIGRAGIRSLVCLPDYEADRITILTRFWNPKNFQANLEFELTDPKGEAGGFTKDVKIDKENGTLSISLQLEDVKLWNLNERSLYKLKVSIPNSPSMETRFGMRGADIERGNFKLNHQTIKVRGVGYPWLFAFHPGTPPRDLELRKELTGLKEAGFNLIRSDGAPLPTQVLDICDEIGMLVIQETTCFNQKSSKLGLENLKDQIRFLIERDGSHPCIFAWAIGSENGSMVLENGNKLLRYTAELDNSRPIFSNLNSVSLDSNGGGKIDIGKVYEPTLQQIGPSEWHKLRITFPLALKTFGMLSTYCSSKDGKSVADGIHGNKSFWERYNYLKDGIQGKILIDGMGVAMPENPEELATGAAKHSRSTEILLFTRLQKELGAGLKQHGISIWKTTEDFWKDAAASARQALVAQIEALFINPNVSGYVLDTYADYGLNFSGLTNWLRQPKPAFESFKKLNRPVYVIAEAEERTPYSGTSAAIKIHMVNDGDLGDYGLLLRVKGPNGRIWHQESLPGRAKPGVNLVGRFKFPVGFEKGRFTFDLNLSKNNKEVMRTEEVFFVPPEVKLEQLLKHIQVTGPMSDTIASFASDTGSLNLAAKVSDISDADLARIFADAKSGKILMLGPITDEEAQRINALKVLPESISCHRSNGTAFGSYHFALQSPVFKDLPSQCLLDQSFADILPTWSLDHCASLTMAAGCASLIPPEPSGRTVDTKTPLIKWGMDIAHLSLGKGKVIFCQFEMLERLGRNAMADALFANLLAHFAKVK